MAKAPFKRGDIVELRGNIGVVLGLARDFNEGATDGQYQSDTIVAVNWISKQGEIYRYRHPLYDEAINAQTLTLKGKSDD